MNHCNLQQNAFMSSHDESRGFVVPVSSVVCPKPRRVSILSNNVIHPLRSHSRYLKPYFFCLFPPHNYHIFNFPEETKKKNEMLNFYFVFLIGFNSQPGAADVCDSQAGAELLDILRRKVSLFSFNVVLCLFDFTMFQLVAM